MPNNLTQGAPPVSAEAMLGQVAAVPIKKLAPPEKPVRKLKCETIKSKAHVEMLDDAIDTLVLDALFTKLYNHVIIDRKEANGLWIMCDPSYIKFNVTQTIDLPKPDGFRPPAVFFQWSDSYHQPWAQPNFVFDVIQMDVGGRPVCLYDKANNVLFMSDVTHNEDCMTALTMLWPAIVTCMGKEMPSPRDRKKIAITIGSDPELEVIDEYGAVVNANNYLKQQHRTTSSNAKIGVDGCGYQLELRPTPASSPEDAIKEIANLMKQVKAEYPNSELSGVGDAYPIGCHIHFGFPKGSFTPPKSMLQALDDFLYYPTLHLNGKARGSYLAPSMYESKSYGFEYRSLPGALLCNPEVATLAFKIAYGVVSSYSCNKNLEYHEYPTVKEYVEIAGLTEEEAQKWVNFCLDEYKQVNMYRVLANWIDPGAKPVLKECGAITFKDEWLKEVLDDLTKEMGTHMRRSKMPLDVMFYGLKESRGAKSTIYLGAEYQLINNPGENGTLQELKDGVCYIGIPRRVRVDLSEYQRVRESLISSAKAKLASFRTAINDGRRRARYVVPREPSTGTRRWRTPVVANTEGATILTTTPPERNRLRNRDASGRFARRNP